MTPIKIPVLMMACLFIFTACTTGQMQADPASAASAATPAPDSMTAEQAVTGIVWPTEDYAALDQEGQEADGTYTFEQQAVPVAEENGKTVYSLSGKLDGGTLVQLNGTAESEDAFARIAAAFAQAAPELLVTAM